MKKIKLTQGKYALVDDEDFEILNQWKWHSIKNGRTFYAGRTSAKNKETKKRNGIRMHIEIIGKSPKGKEIDHKDGNGLNNQRKNLRLVSHSENMINQRQRLNNTSGFRGVSWNTALKKWRTDVRLHTIRFFLGYFTDKLDAKQAYDKFIKENY